MQMVDCCLNMWSTYMSIPILKRWVAGFGLLHVYSFIAIAQVSTTQFDNAHLESAAFMGRLVRRGGDGAKDEQPSNNVKRGSPDRRHVLQGKQSGATYGPLDSWIYTASDRLQALRYAGSALLGMRPWTRKYCARLVK